MWDQLVSGVVVCIGLGYGLRTVQGVWLCRRKAEHCDVYRLLALSLRWLFGFLDRIELEMGVTSW